MSVDKQTSADRGPAGDVARYRFWLLRLVFPGRRGRWITGLAISASLLLLFALAGGFTPAGQAEVGLGVVLFFALILGYIVPVHQLIISRSIRALDTLASRFPDVERTASAGRERLVAKSRAWVTRTLLVGCAAGVGHNALLYGDSDLAILLTHPPTALTAVFTLLIWIVMTAAISSLIENAVLFARLGERIPIELLRIQMLTPFGSVAVSSTLAMIGAQAAFPLLFFQADTSTLTFVPGLIATALPMIVLFFAPIWPVHRRIVATKRAELERLDGTIAGMASGAARELPALAPVLVYRRDVSDASEWPFDTSVVGRLILYLIIPPLTWVGAALIEMLVDTAL